jgi:hypothetical protein
MRRRNLIRVLAAGGVSVAGCTGGDGGSSPETSSTSAAETSTASTTEKADATTAEASGTASVPVGEVVEGDQLSMVVRSVEKTESLGEYQEADQGNTFLLVRLAVKNSTSDAFLNFSGFLQTSLKDGSGYNYSQTIAATGKTFTGGQLAPGEVSRGDIAYEVPKDASDFTLQFDFQAISFFEFDRVTVNLSEQASGIADLQQDLAVETHGTGETVTREQTSVTVNSVEFEEELGSLASAEEGHEYAVIDITTENGTDEEQRISTLLQMLVKDGSGWSYQMSITGTSALTQSYEEATPLAPDEKRRGKLAYEVPKDAKPLYWAFEFSLWVNGDKTFWKFR